MVGTALHGGRTYCICKYGTITIESAATDGLTVSGNSLVKKTMKESWSILDDGKDMYDTSSLEYVLRSLFSCQSIKKKVHHLKVFQ